MPVSRSETEKQASRTRFPLASAPTFRSDRFANLEVRDATDLPSRRRCTYGFRWTRDGKMHNSFAGTSRNVARDETEREQGESESTTHGQWARMRADVAREKAPGLFLHVRPAAFGSEFRNRAGNVRAPNVRSAGSRNFRRIRARITFVIRYERNTSSTLTWSQVRQV